MNAMPDTKTEILSKVPELVNRARQGDQNAMAMIAQVREASLKGSPRAKIAFEGLTEYIKMNPAQPKAVMAGFGAEVVEALQIVDPKNPTPPEAVPTALAVLPNGGKKAVDAGSILLASGPPISSQMISAMGQGIHPAARRIFYFCIAKCGSGANKMVAEAPAGLKTLAMAGRCVGYALKIQMVRLPESIISQFSKMAGWELGEPDIFGEEDWESEGSGADEDEDHDEEDSDNRGGGSGGGGGGGAPSGGGGGGGVAPQAADPNAAGPTPEQRKAWHERKKAERARKAEWAARKKALADAKGGAVPVPSGSTPNPVSVPSAPPPVLSSFTKPLTSTFVAAPAAAKSAAAMAPRPIASPRPAISRIAPMIRKK